MTCRYLLINFKEAESEWDEPYIDYDSQKYIASEEIIDLKQHIESMLFMKNNNIIITIKDKCYQIEDIEYNVGYKNSMQCLNVFVSEYF